MQKEFERSKMNNLYFVYVHTNKINGKKYIGITRQLPERRWKKGAGYDKTYFGNAIKKYGWDCFEHEILAAGLTKEEACKMEIDLILKNKSNVREFGYNISEGGNTCDVLKGKNGIDHPNHQRVKMIDAKTGEVLKIFGAQSGAAQELGISRKGITKACIGVGTATYKGYIWEYADKKHKKPGNPGIGKYEHKKIQKRVIIVDANGEESVYDSVKEAQEKTKTPKNSAWRYLKKGYPDPLGRRWLYA